MPILTKPTVRSSPSRPTTPAGPHRQAAQREAEEEGLDPDKWFNNVELIAAKRVGQETVGYVRNIYKYYAAYKLQLETLEARKAALQGDDGREIGPTGIMAPSPRPFGRGLVFSKRTVMAGHSKWANIQHRKGRQDESAAPHSPRSPRKSPLPPR